MARVVAVSLNPALDLSIGVEALALGEVNRSHTSRLDAAGKGNNVARVLAALGHDVAVTGFLGEANQGAFERAFAAWGVRDAFVRVPGETRVNVKVSEQYGRVTDLNGRGAEVSAQALAELEQILKDEAAGCDAVVVSGSLPPGVSPARFGELLRAVKARGVALWVDTSGPALDAALKCAPTAVKPNEHELSEWAGAPLEGIEALRRAARTLNDEGVASAFVTLGGDGVLLSTPQGQWRARPPRVSVVSTVCAGDTFVAAALHGELSGWAMDETLRFATTLSAEAVRHVGVGETTAADFEVLKTNCVLQQLTDGQPAGEWPA
ncbi:1-phosphofructokinase [Larsenimonas salina]|uniref:1-phosphofructokinase n=1 Tax=Larsenimonas salina TaxID=1295565 RepID=UPI002074139D|nr:1-phosphofructokinase [Larsenimonas salina]MCM5705397.1 1-phosphofructokinase [Larsenimonas salina]